MRLVVLVALVAALVRGEQSRACGGWAYDPTQGLTFDTTIGDPETSAQFFGDELLADWKGYLRETGMSDAEWKKILFDATDKELERVAVKWKSKSRVVDALAFVRLARRVEPFATFDVPKPAAESADVLADAKAAFGKAKDPFMVQRYAFQITRVLFYQHDWPGVIAWFDKNTSVLQAPSAALSVGARYYLAGALVRTNKLARANLELARVFASDVTLAGSAATDFKPKDEADWKESLQLAKDTRDKVALWQLVGIKHDGVVAMQEILKLDPKSNLIGLLMMRELATAEGFENDKTVPGYAPLEKIAQTVIAKGGDRPWLMELVLGHIAARRGDLAHAREHLKKAVDAQPKNARVATQAHASLAIALATNWKIDASHEDELAKTVAGIAKDFPEQTTVRAQVRHKLAQLYAAAGKLTDAEMLEPGTVDPLDPNTGKPKSGKLKWHDVAFIKDMIARANRSANDFDKFVLESSLSEPSLEQDLALRYLLDGDFTAASKTFASTNATSTKLGTDPFVMHIVDCHDCDHEKFANAAWTHASVVQKLVELKKVATGKDEAAADASIQIGNALYNLTWHGNARSMLESSHQDTRDSSAALDWYKHAYEVTKNKETKAKAAFFAAKAELGVALADLDPWAQPNPLPTPKTWFALLRKLDDTKYYKEVLKECGAFRTWAQAHK